MAQTNFSKIDEYGFQRSKNFNYEIYGDFMSQYYRVLAKRTKRWEELKDSEKHKKNNTLKRFVRKGIPISHRTSAWMIVSGAQLLREESMFTYNDFKQQINNQTIIDMIQIDLPRTFPDNIYFSNESLLPSQLFNILAAFAHQNNEVSYCQGLNYIAGLLLLATKDEEATFWLLKVLVEKILPQYYIKTMSGLLTDLEVLDELIKIQDPVVYKHIQDIGMPWAVTTTKWFVCIYAEVLPTETVLRIWDCLFYEGSKILFRVAITLIKLHREQILEARDLSELVVSFKMMAESPNVINCHKFITDIFKIPGSFSRKTLNKLRLKHQPQ
ncbi:Rab-GTPase-TBC domain [Popillia japonica]|uniref:Growth hormone-regulated TBC protein 1 n=1 Tax=Popillia japonica TaxID=7064 RepID=A0AAW1KP17_POPJA